LLGQFVDASAQLLDPVLVLSLFPGALGAVLIGLSLIPLLTKIGDLQVTFSVAALQVKDKFFETG
jgi:hypothetical protein